MALKVGWSGWGREVRWPKREVQAARAGAWAGVGSGRREIFREVVVVVVVVLLLSLFSSRAVCVSEGDGGSFLGIVVVVVVAIVGIDVGSGDGWLCVVVDIFWGDDGMLWFVIFVLVSFSSFLPFFF